MEVEARRIKYYISTLHEESRPHENISTRILRALPGTFYRSLALNADTSRLFHRQIFKYQSIALYFGLNAVILIN